MAGYDLRSVPTGEYDAPGRICRAFWRVFGWVAWRDARGLWWWVKV